LFTIKGHALPTNPRWSTVETRSHPTLVIHTTVTHHLEVLRFVTIGNIGIIKRVSH
jgi:hypothetical protein